MKTLYVTDLDGTLLNTNEMLNVYTINMLNEFIKKGMAFTYATARSLASASIVTKGLELQLPAIVYNGAFVINTVSGERIVSSNYTEEEKQYVISILNRYDVYPLVYAYQDGVEKVSWIPEKETKGVAFYLSKRKGDKRLNPVQDREQLYKGQVFYFTCIGEKEALEPIYHALKENLNYNCLLQKDIYDDSYWCEVMPKKATKANAIQQLKEIYQFDRLVTFGDAINDIPMFQISDECYAVENAVSQLKEIATGIISDSNHDGVVKWLEERIDI